MTWSMNFWDALLFEYQILGVLFAAWNFDLLLNRKKSLEILPDAGEDNFYSILKWIALKEPISETGSRYLVRNPSIHIIPFIFRF